jgi:hypothetical protein
LAGSGAPSGFELEIEIAVRRARLHAFLGDLAHFSALHPLIESIRPLPVDPARPRALRYRVVDRLPVGPFRLRTVYTAALEPISDHEIRGEAWQSPGVHLLTRYQLEERGDTTRLRESVSLEAPFGLRRFVHHQARSAHRTTLERIKRLLEAPEPPA